MKSETELKAKCGGAEKHAPTRILHVIPALGPGGSERFLLDLLDHLGSARFETHVGVLQDVCSFPERLTGKNVTFLDSNLRWSDPVDTVRTVRRLRRLIGEVRPAVVHSHLWPATRMAALALLGTRIPHAVHIHNCWSMAPLSVAKRLKGNLIDLLLSRRPTRFIAVSNHTRSLIGQYQRSTRGRTDVILNGTDIAAFSGQRAIEERRGERQRLVIASVGSIEHRKGQDLLINAAALLVADGIDIEVLLVGDGPRMQDYRELAAAKGIDSHVRFLGLVEDVPAVLDRADIFVLASRNEEMPLCVLEAMAMGMPVVASRVGGIPEMIEDGRNGLLLENLSAAALAAALARLAASPDLRHKLGRAARDTVVERFTFAQTARRIEKLYESLVDTPASPASSTAATDMTFN